MMFAPQDYTLDVVDPMTRALQGYNTGQGILLAQNQDARAAQDQTFQQGLQSQEMQMRQDEAAMRREEVARAQAANQAWVDLMQNPNPSTQDFFAVMEANPEHAAEIKSMMDGLSQQGRDKIKNDALGVAYALKANPDVGLSLIDAQIAAAEAAGDAAARDGWQTVRDAAAIDPDAAARLVATPAISGMAFEEAQTVVDKLWPPKPESTLEWRAATPDEAAANGAVAGQINIKTGKFDAQNPPSGMSMTTNPDGTMTFAQGPGVGLKPLTEAQSKDNVFATRAQGALDALEAPSDPNDPASPPLASALSNLSANVAEKVPMVGNYMVGETFQTARTAGDEFLQSILRKDTGAAITVPEQQLYGVTYLPQPGDSPRRLRYKKEARARAVEAIKSGMSVQQLEAMAKAEAKVIKIMEGQPAAQGKADFSAMTPEMLMQVDVSTLTADELDAFNAAIEAIP